MFDSIGNLREWLLSILDSLYMKGLYGDLSEEEIDIYYIADILYGIAKANDSLQEFYKNDVFLFIADEFNESPVIKVLR